MNKQSAFEQGFQKRASEYGLNQKQANELIDLIQHNPEVSGALIGGGVGAGAGALASKDGDRGNGALKGGLAGAGLGLGAGYAYHRGGDMKREDLDRAHNNEQVKNVDYLLKSYEAQDATDALKDSPSSVKTNLMDWYKKRHDDASSAWTKSRENEASVNDTGNYHTLLKHIFGSK